MTRIVPTLAASALLGILGAAALPASPASAFGLVLGDRGYTTSTRHWDHYFHTPSQYDEPGSIDRDRYERRHAYGRDHAVDPGWYGPAPVLLPY